ncbi:hypothetical protein Q3G72_020104 [Acer saccharum]|nr:hypothetical protein Q3G72_020104 [Acer saccharum]
MSNFMLKIHKINDLYYKLKSSTLQLFFPFWFSEKDFREKTEDLCRLGLLCCQLLELQKSSGFVISLYLSLSSSSSSTLASNFGLLKFYTETYRDSPLFPCNQDQKWILFGESVLKIV